MTTFRLLDLFSGIGGFSLGLERSGGFKTVAFCEIDPFCRKVLRKHWPDVPCYEDVRTLTADRLRADGIAVDAICGGFPCQDISESNVAGTGLDGARSGLWTEFARLIGELRPRYVIVENVSNLLGRGLGKILGYLATVRYDAEWHRMGANDLGAPHERHRIWIVAYPAAQAGRSLNRSRRRMARQNPVLSWPQITSRFASGAENPWHQSWSEFINGLSRVDDGLSRGVGEHDAYANSVVPKIPEIIGRTIIAAEESNFVMASDHQTLSSRVTDGNCLHGIPCGQNPFSQKPKQPSRE